jgi:hypothetical protein
VPAHRPARRLVSAAVTAPIRGPPPPGHHSVPGRCRRPEPSPSTAEEAG